MSTLAASPPGRPRGLSVVNGLRMTRDPIGCFTRWRDEVGDPFRLRIGDFYDIVYTARADHVKTILAAPEAVLQAGPANMLIAPLVGRRSTLTLDGAEHARHRRLVMPPLHGAALASYDAVIAEEARRELSGWRPGETVMVRARMQHITLHVMARIVFGAGGDDPRDRALVEALTGFVDEAGNLAMFVGALRRDLGPRSPWGRFLRKRAVARELLGARIAERRASGERGEDLLSLLLDAEDDDGSALADADVQDEVLTALVAGYETTATALSWAVDALLRAPAELERLREGGSERMDAAVSEILRLHPPVFDCVRMAVQPFALGEHIVPVGTVVAPLTALLHRDPDVWPEPDRFGPDRFEGGSAQYGFSYLPFGGGRRRCVGAALARAEIAGVLAVWLEEGPSLELVDLRSEPVRLSTVTLVPGRGVPVRVV